MTDEGHETGNQRILLIGGVALMRGKVLAPGKVMVEICDEWEPLLKRARFVEGAPFSMISLIILFGEKESLEPELGKINAKHQELPVRYELPMDDIQWKEHDELKAHFDRATLRSLQKVAETFDLALPVRE